MTFGKKITSLRKSKNMSQDQLAELLGVSRQSVSKWERDEVIADTDRILAISKLFHVSCDYLLNDTIEAIQAQSIATPPSAQATVSAKHSLSAWQRNWYWLGLLPLIWGLVDLISLYQLMNRYTTIHSLVHLLKLAFAALQEPYFESDTVLALFAAFLYASVKILLGLFLILYGRIRVKKALTAIRETDHL